MKKLAVYIFIFAIGFWAGFFIQHKKKGAEIHNLKVRLEYIEREIEIMEIMQKIIHCESSGRHEGVWGDGGRAYGIAQFHEGTFYYLSRKADFKGNWKDRKEQIVLLRWALENGYGEHWTCYGEKL